MITIFVNDEPLQINENASIVDVLKTLHREEDKRMAIAVNQTIVSKINWGNTLLKANDKLTVIKAAYGG